jgi:predicted TIM-barrel fold metal-dependent hydrolase
MMHVGEDGVRNLDALKSLDAAGRAAIAELPKFVSVDSHIQEPDAVWEQLPPRLYEKFQEETKRLRFKGEMPGGAMDPKLRLLDQDTDNVEVEILFPNNGMAIFGFEDIETQQASFQLYNDHIADFCKVDPKRLIGVPTISVYDTDAAIKEMHRAWDMGLVGIMVWQVPDPKLPFMSEHYEPIWAAAAEAGAPVHMHILTGHSYNRTQHLLVGAEKLRGAVNQKTHDAVTTLFDMIFSGAFDRHPKLQVVLAESECGWLPFMLQQWDYYFERIGKREKLPISRKPSEIFEEQVFCTWLEDFSGTRHFNWWGQNNLMWSNDYPHANMTFPYSRENVVHHIGNLPKDIQNKLIRDNAIRLYKLDL